MLVALAHRQPGAAAPDEADLARSLRVLHDDVIEVVEALRAAGLLRSLERGGLVPGRPEGRITLLDVRRAVHGPVPARSAVTLDVVERTLAGIEQDGVKVLQGVTLQQLCDRAGSSPEQAPAGLDRALPSGPAEPPVVGPPDTP